jgi:hypothetical protein
MLLIVGMRQVVLLQGLKLPLGLVVFSLSVSIDE